MHIPQKNQTPVPPSNKNNLSESFFGLRDWLTSTCHCTPGPRHCYVNKDQMHVATWRKPETNPAQRTISSFLADITGRHV